MRILSLLLISVLALPSVTAQEGCDQATPCIWSVQVDETGLSAPGGDLEGTVGDWFYFEFNNVDPEHTHTITWLANGTSWQVESISSVDSAPFELTDDGTFELRDENTGDTLPVTITLDDVANGGSGDQGTPGLGIAVVPALLGAVLMRRR